MKRLLPFLFTLLFVVAPLRADGISDPSGDVILIVHGAIEITNGPGPAAMFDRAILESLGMQTIRTATPFTDGPITFRGPYLRDLLDILVVTGDTLHAHALDDYNAVFPVSDAYDHDFILAIDDDRGLLSPDQFGPIWIVGPMDDDPMIGEEAMQDRWVWQLSRIEIN